MTSTDSAAILGELNKTYIKKPLVKALARRAKDKVGKYKKFMEGRAPAQFRPLVLGFHGAFEPALSARCRPHGPE